MNFTQTQNSSGILPKCFQFLNFEMFIRRIEAHLFGRNECKPAWKQGANVGTLQREGGPGGEHFQSKMERKRTSIFVRKDVLRKEAVLRQA